MDVAKIKKTEKRKKATVQRLKILSYLKSTKEHPTAEDVFNAIKDDVPGITLATVYRNLNEFAAEKAIKSFELGRKLHFDADTKPHIHFFCEKCKRTFDIYNSRLISLIIKHTEQYSEEAGFEITSFDLFYKGLCKSCKAPNKKNTQKNRWRN